jgi:hypothetical protein
MTTYRSICNLRQAETNPVSIYRRISEQIMVQLHNEILFSNKKQSIRRSMTFVIYGEEIRVIR